MSTPGETQSCAGGYGEGTRARPAAAQPKGSARHIGRPGVIEGDAVDITREGRARDVPRP